MRQLLAFGAVACIGCSTQVAVPDGGAAGDMAGQMSNGGTPDLGPFPDPSGNWGIVSVLSTAYQQGTTQFTIGGAGAIFTSVTGASPQSCSVTKTGDCFVETCTAVGQGGTTSYEDAGAITVGGASQPVSISFSGMMNYTPYQSGGHLLFSGGETLTISAAGATVPAFATTVVAPTALTFTAPAFPTTGKLTIAKAIDFTLSWSPAGSATVTAQLLPAAGKPSIVCSTAASAGTLVIPAQVLSQIASGSGAMSLTVRNTSVVATGNWIIEARAETYPLQAMRNVSDTLVQFQ